MGQVYVQGSEAKGTINYMCPELFEAGIAITDKVDVWAGACCVVEMLTGKMPFVGLQLVQIMKKISDKGKPPELTDVNISLNVKKILDRCFQFNQSMRPTAAVLIAEFEKLLPEQESRPEVIFVRFLFLNLFFKKIKK